MKFLFISEAVPWPTTSGSSQRSYLLHQSLLRHGVVDLVLCQRSGQLQQEQEETLRRDFGLKEVLPFKNQPASCGRGFLRRLPGRVGGAAQLLHDLRAEYTTDSGFRARLETWLGRTKYDFVVVRYAGPALRLGVDGIATGARRLIDVDDVPWRAVAAEIDARRGKRKPTTAVLDAIRCWYVRKLIRPRLRRFDHIWVTKEGDLESFASTKVSVLPNIPFGLEKIAPIGAVHSPSAPTLLFVGTIDYPPNWSGLRWFLDFVWPRIREAVPNAMLRVVGVKADQAFSVNWDQWPGVVYEGAIEDLSEAYQSCAATIAPIRWGGGTKIKVLESLAYARPCIVTPHALEGFERLLRHSDSVLIADTALDFAQACVQLLTVPGLGDAMGQKGRENILAHFTRTRFDDEVARVISLPA